MTITHKKTKEQLEDELTVHVYNDSDFPPPDPYPMSQRILEWEKRSEKTLRQKHVVWGVATNSRKEGT